MKYCRIYVPISSKIASFSIFADLAVILCYKNTWQEFCRTTVFDMLASDAIYAKKNAVYSE